METRHLIGTKPGKDLVLLSGGIDSATALAWLLSNDRECLCLGIDYGAIQNKRELRSAAKVAAHYRVPFVERSFPFGSGWGGSLMDPDSQRLNGSPTVVSGRNAILCSIAAGFAQDNGCSRVIIGCNATDRETYPDCRVEFLLPLSLAFRQAYGVSLDAPLIELEKRQIVELGNGLGVPLESLTYSCYRGGEEPCGVCGACWERQQAGLLVQLAEERPERLERARLVQIEGSVPHPRSVGPVADAGGK